MAKKVLIVDDSASIRHLVRQTLTEAHFEVIEASDGAAGLETIASTEDLAAAICDINMPRMNGLEMVEQVRREPKHASLPIIMLTTEGQAELIQRAKRAGARGWIVKPFKPQLLVSALQKITSG